MNELHIDVVEGAWLAINLVAAVLTFAALVDAWSLRTAALPDRGARLVQATGNVRREIFRLAGQIGFLLLLVIGGGLTSDVPTVLSPFVLILIAVSLFILANTLGDAWDRRRLAGMVWAEIEAERTAGFSRIERQLAQTRADLAENTRISQGARDDAHTAAEAANSVNEKIANNAAAIVAQGEERASDRRDRADDRAADRKADAATAATVQDTSEKVTDIHTKVLEP